MNGFGNFRRADGVGNRSLDNTGNGNDIAGMSFIFADAVEAFISQNFGNTGAFDFALFVDDFDRIIDLQAAGVYFPVRMRPMNLSASSVVASMENGLSGSQTGSGT